MAEQMVGESGGHQHNYCDPKSALGVAGKLDIAAAGDTTGRMLGTVSTNNGRAGVVGASVTVTGTSVRMDTSRSVPVSTSLSSTISRRTLLSTASVVRLETTLSTWRTAAFSLATPRINGLFRDLQEVTAVIDDAVAYAESSPEPHPADALKHVFYGEA